MKYPTLAAAMTAGKLLATGTRTNYFVVPFPLRKAPQKQFRLVVETPALRNSTLLAALVVMRPNGTFFIFPEDLIK